jgi:hypothetical protein
MTLDLLQPAQSGSLYWPSPEWSMQYKTMMPVEEAEVSGLTGEQNRDCEGDDNDRIG